MVRPKSLQTTCLICGHVFDETGKSRSRTNVFTNIKKKNFTPSDALSLLGVNVSPVHVKEKYCCTACVLIVRDYYGAHLTLTESKVKLLEGVKSSSYLGSKLINKEGDVFSTPRKGLKRLQSVFPSPIKHRHIQPETTSPKVSFRTYTKKSKQKHNKVVTPTLLFLTLQTSL